MATTCLGNLKLAIRRIDKIDDVNYVSVVFRGGDTLIVRNAQAVLNFKEIEGADTTRIVDDKDFVDQRAAFGDEVIDVFHAVATPDDPCPICRIFGCGCNSELIEEFVRASSFGQGLDRDE